MYITVLYRYRYAVRSGVARIYKSPVLVIYRFKNDLGILLLFIHNN
jgi:hypothetical protein